MLLNVALYGNLAVALISLIFILFIFRRESLPLWEKLPRERWSGAFLGLAVLLAFIPDVEPMFSVEKYLAVLIAAAVLLTLACFLWADFLFARAYAGLLIITAHTSLAECYAADLHFHSFFAVMSLASGTAGIFLAAKPYWMRDLIRKVSSSKVWKFSAAAFYGLWILSVLLLIFFGR